VSLREPGPVAGVRVDAGTAGWAGQIYVASTSRATLPGWGRAVATIPTGHTGENLIQFAQPVQGGYVLVWFTNLGKDGSMTVRDISVEGRS
jgi:hypothetical protein